MKRLIIFFILLSGCSFFRGIFPGDKPDHSHDPWLPHKATAWRVTPKGHTRDAGPFVSVTKGYATDADIDAAVDSEFDYFYSKLPQFAGLQARVWINDDYVMWVGTWAAGVTPYGRGSQEIGVCLWSRGNSTTDPGNVWIKRAPGVDQWGENHPGWRYTIKPLCPGLAHELLHVAIGDPLHTTPLWATLGR